MVIFYYNYKLQPEAELEHLLYIPSETKAPTFIRFSEAKYTDSSINIHKKTTYIDVIGKVEDFHTKLSEVVNDQNIKVICLSNDETTNLMFKNTKCVFKVVNPIKLLKTIAKHKKLYEN